MLTVKRLVSLSYPNKLPLIKFLALQKIKNIAKTKRTKR